MPHTQDAYTHSANGATGPPMPAETKQETWLDWWPGQDTDPDQLLTRQELADRAVAEGIAVSAQEISNWQRAGILPRGIPHRVGRTLTLLYPPHYVSLLRDVRAMQAAGLTLRETAGELRVKHFHRFVIDVPTATAMATAVAPLVLYGDHALMGNDSLNQTLRQIAREHEHAYGSHIARVELRLIDDHGNPLTLTVVTD